MKKRFLSILLSLCLIITLLPSHALAATNRLANPGGEAVAENTYGMLCQNGWTEENTPYRGYSYTGFDGTGTTKGIVLAPKSGDYFMGFFAASGSCYQDIMVTDSMKDDVYSLTGYLAAKNAASTSGATSAVLKIEQIDSSDNVILNTASETSVSAETGWTQKTLTGTVNAGAAKLRVSIAGVLAESINSLAAFDDLSLLVTPSVTSVITKAATANGSFTVSAESASTGKTVTISPAPDINYVVDTISVTKTGEPGTTVTVNDDNTFTMPAYPVTVTVTYKAAALTGTVTISGSLILGEMLTAGVSGSNNTGTLSYQWKRGNTGVGTGITYTTVEADVGKTITCVVSSSVQAGSISGSTSSMIANTALGGEIKAGTGSWKHFLNTLTSGLFFKDTQTVTVTGSGGTGTYTVSFFTSADDLTEEAVKAKIEGWQSYTAPFFIMPNTKDIVYVRIADGMNTVYLRSDRITADSAEPAFSLTDSTTYTSAQTLIVSDNYALSSVLLNGTEQLAASFTGKSKAISLSANGTHTIKAVDRAGNEAQISVTVSIPVPPIRYNLVSIKRPDDLTGVINGTAPERFSLPESVTIDSGSGGPTSAKVTWDIASARPAYDPAVETKQVFTINGTAALPQNVTNTNSVSLNITIFVTVAAKEAVAVTSVTIKKQPTTKTGDSSNTILWSVLLLVSGGALISFRSRIKRKKSNG